MSGGIAVNENKSSYGGMGLVGWLTLLFIGLKLTGHIEWSWLWVLSPIWVLLGGATIVGVILGIIGVIKATK